MEKNFPYMLSPGRIPTILGKIQQARRPERFTQDFLETKLAQKGGSARSIIPLLKRMGLLASDGTPTPRYDKFRNEQTQGVAIAEGMKSAFSDLFERNEYANDLTKDKLTSLVIEITGSTKEDRTTQAIIGTFFALKEFADFESTSDNSQNEGTINEISKARRDNGAKKDSTIKHRENVDFRVSYTINLNLPETTDPEVFNAIFKSLKQNILEEE